MADDFYEPLSSATLPASGLVYNLWNLVLSPPPGVIIAFFLAPFLIIISTRVLSGHPSERISGHEGKTVAMLSYYFPLVGHGLSLLYDPIKLMSHARDQSRYGIFALNLGTTTHNIISDPTLVKNIMQQKESVVRFQPMAWGVVQRFFGIPNSSERKYQVIWDELNSLSNEMLREPLLGNLIERTIRNLEENIPQMISFIDTEIDLQPWERSAKARFLSSSESEINLMSLLRDMIAYASVPAMFGRALLEKCPGILHDVYEMDRGMMYFLMGLPPWTPWPSVMKAHLSRARVWQCLDDHQRALDASVDGRPVDSTWGDVDDVSDIIMKRHALFKDNGFEVKERGDITILWALIVNANLLVYWQLLHILATPGLANRLRAEIAPYAQVSKPASIGTISEAPKVELSPEGLAKKCPLLKSTYFEALRLSAQPWSVRYLASDVILKGDKSDPDACPFIMKKGEYVTVPHDLHMRDPKYFKDPEKFNPDRFLVRNKDGSLSTDMGTIRPYGGGMSMCKGRIFAERECLALVAGVLVFWDIKPVDEETGWTIPSQKKTSAVSLPVHETRVRIKRKRFEWEE